MDRASGDWPDEEREPALATNVGWLVAGCALAALLWDPLAPAACPKRVLGMAMAVVGAALALSRGLRRGGAKETAWPLGVWGLVALATWTGGSLAWGAADGTGEVATVVLFAATAAIATSQTTEHARQVATTTCSVVGGVTALVVLVQVLLGHGVHAGHGNPNRAGLVLGVALLPAVGMTVTAWRQRHAARYVLSALVAAWLPALFLARSHTSWLAVAIGLLVTWLAERARRPLTQLALASVPFGVGVLATIAADPIGRLLPNSIGDALRGRAWLWSQSWTAAVGELPLGAGAGGFGRAYLEAQGAALADLPVDLAAHRYHYVLDAHHDALHTLVVSGPVGLALLVGCLAVALHDHMRSHRPWLAGAIAVLVVAGAGDAPLLRPACAIIAGLLVGASSKRLAWEWGAPYRWGLLLVGLAWLLPVETRTWVAQRWMTQARDALPAERLARLEGATELQPNSGRAHFELGLARLEAGDATGATTALERADTLLPGPTTRVALGNARARSGNLEGAVEAFRSALTLHPGSFRAHANLASTLTTLDRYDAAARHLARARDLYPGHPRLTEIGDRLQRAQRDAATQ